MFHFMHTPANAKEKATNAMNAATNALHAGFDSKSSQKSAMETLRKAWEFIKNTYQAHYLSLSSQKKSTDEQQELYYSFPEIHVWKEKHATLINAAFPDEVFSGMTDVLCQLATLRNTIKSADVTPRMTKERQQEVLKQEPVNAKNLEILRNALFNTCSDMKIRYEEMAKNYIACVRREWNGDLAAFYTQYDKEHILSVIFHQIAIKTHTGYVLDNDRIARFVAQYIQQAEDDFESFLTKMVFEKIGANSIDTATVQGSLWSGSILSIQFKDGTQTKLHTQCIVNVSKLGKLFNQWPTRKVA